MSVTHTNRRGKTYYLHTGPKRGGGIQHYLSTKRTGALADSIPEGFEIYETANGQVYLRRRPPSLIRDEELQALEALLTQHRGPNRYRLERCGDRLIVHESETNLGLALEINPFLSRQEHAALSERFAYYQAILRFVLKDANRRLFAPERYCFRGSVDDWISIGPPGRLLVLARRYFKHLGKESFYELY